MKKITTLILIAFFIYGCGKEEVKNTYNSQVYFTIDVRNQDNTLNAPMQAKAFETPRFSSDRMGYGGLLAVCSTTLVEGTVSYYHLFAYDLACTKERNPNVRVVPDNEGNAKCPKCGSVYDIFNGGGRNISGPSTTNLQVYRVTPDYSNAGVFRVTR